MISVRFSAKRKTGWLRFADLRVNIETKIIAITGRPGSGRKLTLYDHLILENGWKPGYGPMPTLMVPPNYGSRDYDIQMINGYRRRYRRMQT